MHCAAGCGEALTNDTFNVRQLCCGQYYHLGCLLTYFRKRTASIIFTEITAKHFRAGLPEDLFCPYCRQPFVNLADCAPLEFRKQLSELLLFYLRNSPTKDIEYPAPVAFKPSGLTFEQLTEYLLADERFEKLQKILRDCVLENQLRGDKLSKEKSWKRLLDRVVESRSKVAYRDDDEIAQFYPAFAPHRLGLQTISNREEESTYPVAIGSGLALMLIWTVALFILPYVVYWDEKITQYYYPTHEIDAHRLAAVDKRCTAFSIAVLLMAITLNKKLFVGRETITTMLMKNLGAALLLLTLAIALPGNTAAK